MKIFFVKIHFFPQPQKRCNFAPETTDTSMPQTKQYGFPKSEHLVGKKNIASLYAKGNKLSESPLLLIYTFTDAAESARVLFSVPKRHFRHASARNRYKRLLREAYRLNKSIITESLSGRPFGIDMAITVTNTEVPNFVSTERNIIGLLTVLATKIYEKDI